MGIFSSPRYQEVVIHDLRTPLNVINLALRMIDEFVATSNPDMAEDLAMIKANSQEIDRMLTHLVDFSRLPEDRSQLAIERFDPRRMVADLIDEMSSRGKSGPIELSLDASPAEVSLDFSRARMAVQKTLLNCLAAASGKPVRVGLAGAPDRLAIEFAIDAPPRDSVQTQDLSDHDFERIIGTPAERRGLELTIASRISQIFGGSARIEANPGQGTKVILDWPRALDPGA